MSPKRLALATPINRVPIRTRRGILNTFEVVCAVCGDTKFPTLSAPPARSWVCALCRLRRAVA